MLVKDSRVLVGEGRRVYSGEFLRFLAMAKRPPPDQKAHPGEVRTKEEAARDVDRVLSSQSGRQEGMKPGIGRGVRPVCPPTSRALPFLDSSLHAFLGEAAAATSRVDHTRSTLKTVSRSGAFA
jgi:hypothetical protein